jgi:hypothetical protein
MMWIAGIVGAILLSLAARDVWGWLPLLSRLMIWLETAPLPKERRAVRRAEWGAELEAEYDDRRLSGLMWTLRLGPISAWERFTTPISVPSIDARAMAARSARFISIVAPRAFAVAVLASLVSSGLVSEAMAGFRAVTAAVVIPAAILIFGVELWIFRRLRKRRPPSDRRRRDHDQYLARRRMGTVQILRDLNYEPTALSLSASKELCDAEMQPHRWLDLDLSATPLT